MEVLEVIIKAYISLKKNSTMTEDEIDKRINDEMGRKIIRDTIKMSSHSFVNHYTQLKKKKVITEDNKLQSFLKQIDNEVVNMTLNINYKIKVHPKNESAKKSKISQTTQ